MTYSTIVKSIGFDFTLKLITWGFIGLFTFYFWLQKDQNIAYLLAPTQLNLMIGAGLFLAFIGGCALNCFSRNAKLIGLAVQGATLLCLMYLFQSSILLGLCVILVAQLVEHFKLTICILLAFLLPMFHVILTDHNQDYVLMNAALFSMFNLFALLLSYKMKAERLAREKASHLLRELKATQSLLSSTSRRDERLRIARDLHDLMGHHLTALNIQLEITSQLVTESATSHIGKAQSITRILLNDVRDAVAEFRGQNQLDLTTALRKLTEDIDSLSIALQLQENLSISDARVAEALFRAAQEGLTNVLKHSDANYCLITLTRKENALLLTIKDNGRKNKPIIKGNGLRGMQERLTRLDGDLHIHSDGSGVMLNIRIPDEEHPG